MDKIIMRNPNNNIYIRTIKNYQRKWEQRGFKLAICLMKKVS